MWNCFQNHEESLITEKPLLKPKEQIKPLTVEV